MSPNGTQPHHMRVPDLLKRFTPTPFRARFQMGSAEVMAETNDAGICDALRGYVCGSYACEQNFSWKLVRDHGIRHQPLEPVTIRQGHVVVLSMGPACLIGIDCRKRELLGFLGEGIDAEAFQAVVLPHLRQIIEDVKAMPETGPDRGMTGELNG